MLDQQNSALSGGMSGFIDMDKQESDKDGSSQRPDWHEEDIARAIAIAKEAGLTSYRVEIASDGTISIIVGEPSPD